MAINALIIEDNPQAAQALEELLRENMTINLLGKATTLEAGKELILEMRPSLLFLDVEMPDGNGIDFWHEMQATCGWLMHAIFYTAFDHYAIQALRAKAFDYLVKPVQQDELNKALHRFFADCTEQLVKMQQAGVNVQPQNTLNMLVLDNQNHRISLKASDICLFRYVGDRKIWEALCVNGCCYTLHHGVNAAKLLQISEEYVQVHKSYIVNTMHIARIENNCILFYPPYEDLREVQISKIYKNNLFSRFCQL